MSARRLAAAVVVGMLASGLLAQGQNDSPPSPTATPTPFLSQVLAADIYVRSGPGLGYVPVGGLRDGAFVVPASRSADGEWVMIRYSHGFGWVRRDLVYWVEDLDALPILLEDALTPTVQPGSESPTPFFPTPTPVGNWVSVGPEGALLRAGPGRGYLRLGTLTSGILIEEPLGRNQDATWVMFRYGDGFAWIARNLVVWSSDVDGLPVLSENRLTPTATHTASLTATTTSTPTAIPTATSTASATPTPTATVTSTATATLTASPTASATPTSTSTASATPSATPTATVTNTPTATLTASPTASATPT
ncbi:MAG: hypothetical protein ACUVSX_03625, partial [Aggregatilineales bacterium]